MIEAVSIPLRVKSAGARVAILRLFRSELGLVQGGFGLTSDQRVVASTFNINEFTPDMFNNHF